MSKSSTNGGKLSHIDARGQPAMVDVSEKDITARRARARSWVILNETVVSALRSLSEDADELRSAKGPVFQTAIIAGTMAVKKTSELIPFCHPLPIERCDIAISLFGYEVRIDCTVAVTGRTGVEMEALTGASVAALTVYDMCKALSPDIVIRETKLIEKSGGRHNFTRPPSDTNQ
ncbi:MAG: cyclic pyranopterin monophosphate synthase MoaC [Tunicatimonas sp.]